MLDSQQDAASSLGSIFTERVLGSRSQNIRSSLQRLIVINYPNKITQTCFQLFTLILYTGCILFSMHSSTTFLTCLRPLNDPMAATVFPYFYQQRKHSSNSLQFFQKGHKFSLQNNNLINKKQEIRREQS